MTAVNSRRPMRRHNNHGDDDDDRDNNAAAAADTGAAASTTVVAQPSTSSMPHNGGVRVDESLAHTTRTITSANVSISSDSSSGGDEDYSLYKQRNKTRNNAKEARTFSRVFGASFSRRKHRCNNKQRQQRQQQKQQHVSPNLYYPFLVVLLIISFLSMSFSPFVVYIFLPDDHHHQQQFHPPTRITTALTDDIHAFSNEKERSQQQRQDLVSIGSNSKDTVETEHLPEQQQQQAQHRIAEVPSPNIQNDTFNNSTVPTNIDTSSLTSSSYIIRPLRPGIDYDQYTVRINTWKRPAQLRVVLQHLSSASCRSSIAQIQVIWCLAQGPVPDWLQQFNHDADVAHDFVVVETHEENSLNERFHVLREPPTFGILTVDDDVIRPCLALDAAFVKWTRNPHRMVGFDARSHVITKNIINNTINNQPNNTNIHNDEVWAYGYLSTTQNMNRYSSSLTRFAFLHVDYLYSYMTDMPVQIRQVVAQNLNCEDIAMSFWISKQSSLYAASLYASTSSSSVLSQRLPPPPPQAPLLADLWVIQSQVKLATGEKSISAGKDHKKMRDACVNDFANWLQLKGQLKLTEWVHYENTTATSEYKAAMRSTTSVEANKAKKSVFECGAAMDVSIAAAADEPVHASVTAQAVKERIDLWMGDTHIMLQDLKQLSAETRRAAKNQLLTNSQTTIKK